MMTRPEIPGLRLDIHKTRQQGMPCKIDHDSRIRNCPVEIDIDNFALAYYNSRIGQGMIAFAVDKPVGKNSIGLAEAANRSGNQQHENVEEFHKCINGFYLLGLATFHMPTTSFQDPAFSFSAKMAKGTEIIDSLRR
jgi:hypothetical protein